MSFRVADVRVMSNILEVFSYLDDIRWESGANYNLINYCANDLTPDERLLSHWLCYITDRGMPFRRIWDVGGYVISHLVRSYTRRRTGRDVSKLFLEEYVKIGPEEIRIECPIQNKNALLTFHGVTGDKVPFKPRYVPIDLVLIYRTLQILANFYGKSFSKFVSQAISGEMDYRRCIRRMATALDQLTYRAGGTVSKEKVRGKFNKVAKETTGFRVNFDRELDRFNRKRLWCSLRDYLKSPEFNKNFVEGLRKAGVADWGRWRRTEPSLKASLDVLELPGDVWNNAPVFRKGLFAPYIKDVPERWKMPGTIREIYDFLKAKNLRIRFYPEQLDVSFDFVPRMCENRMCDVCIFGAGTQGACHQKPGYLCPVVLSSCGYRHRCAPCRCVLKADSVKGTCRSFLPGSSHSKRA